jgi:flagellar hook-associated protein 3 FlgL
VRISTNSLFTQGIGAIGDRQVNLARIQQQLSTGLRMPSAAADPVGWSTAVSIDRAIAELEQYGGNATILRNRLEQADASLDQIGDRLARVRELALQGANGTYTDEQRRAIALELRQQLNAVVDAANTTDGNGRYLFGGSADAVPPFAFGPAGASYAGDQNRRSLEVAPETAVEDVDPGSEIFLRIRTGDGTFVVRQDPANTGTGVLRGTALVDPGQWDGGNYRIVFNAGNWQALDAANAVVATGAYVEGAPIEFRGVRVQIEGAPANGDAFAVGPSRTQDVFTTLQGLIDALELPTVTPQQRAAQRNAVFAGIEDLTRAQDHIIDRRAGLGARLNVVEQANDGREANGVLLKTALSELRDVDYAKAISQLNLEMTALQAAQQSFIKVQGLSLFSYIR